MSIERPQPLTDDTYGNAHRSVWACRHNIALIVASFELGLGNSGPACIGQHCPLHVYLSLRC